MLGVKGCLDARKNRALSDYARNVTQIVEETDQTSKAFFDKLDEPGSLSVTEFINQVSADRSAMDNYASRVDGLDAPGDMSHAQNALELIYELRASAMNEIAEKMSTALGDVGSEQATRSIAKQMQKLLGSDVLYAAVVRPEINGVLAANGIDGSDVPKSIFLADETRWLDESEVSAALGSVSGSSSGSATSGVHGLGLISTSINGTELTRRIDHLGDQRRHARSRSRSRRTRANRPRTGSTSRSASAAARPSRARSTASAPANRQPSRSR